MVEEAKRKYRRAIQLFRIHKEKVFTVDLTPPDGYHRVWFLCDHPGCGGIFDLLKDGTEDTCRHNWVWSQKYRLYQCDNCSWKVKSLD